MNKTELTRKVYEIASSHSVIPLPSDPENLDIYLDLGMDSLDAVEFMLDLEREFGIKIPDEDAAKHRVLGDIAGCLEIFVGRKPDTPKPAAVQPKPVETEITLEEIKSRRWKKDQPEMWDLPQFKKKSGKYQMSLYQDEDGGWIFQVDLGTSMKAAIDVRTFEQTEVIMDIIKSNDKKKKTK